MANTRLTLASPLRRLRPLAATFCILFSGTLAFADGRVSGRVVDAATQAGLPGAEISVAGSPAKAVTATDGTFALSLPAGQYRLSSYYLGYPEQSLSVTVTDGATADARFSLGDSEVIKLEAFTVEGTREGQARALNQQRTAQNLTNIISSDLSGQFPDKTIADAVKRLPGVTVETDTDTGGSEGRYITIRGMNADFNAVSVNGMRVAVSDFGGLSRRVPLDVVSAKSADQIEVTKALRPDQDGDGIGGAVNIVTRSPLDRDGLFASAEAMVGTTSISDDYTSGYPYNGENYEFAAAFSSPLGGETQHGLGLSVNFRDRAFLKQRVGTTGWRTVGGFYRPDAIAMQHFYDDVKSAGLAGTYAWHPGTQAKFRFDVTYNNRDTTRGRDRQVIYYGNVDAGAANDGETYTAFTSSSSNTGNNRRMERNVRQFFEEQQILTVVATGEVLAGEWTLTPMLGVSRGEFDGDPTKDISARFRTNRGITSFNANGYQPRFDIASVNRLSTSEYFLNSLDRGSSSVADENLTAALDAKRNAVLVDGEGFWKFGVKGSLFDRDYDKSENFFFRNSASTPDIFAADALASYLAGSTLDGAYDYGFFLDPEKIRAIANRPGALDSPALDNAPRARLNSYEVSENIGAVYGLGQFAWGKFTALAGVRVEQTRINFTGFSGATDSFGDVMASSLTPFDRSREYVDVLPGVQLRYDQSRSLAYRFSVNRTIARPRLADLNPSRQEDRLNRELIIGDFNLDRTTSTNVDLSVDYYFADAGVLSATAFTKELRDNIYTTRSASTDPAFDVFISRANAQSAWVRGIELNADYPLSFLPAPANGLRVFANYTYANSEVDTGIAVFQGTKLPLFNQVETTVNAGLAYEKYGLNVRAALLYRSESLLELATDPGRLGSPYDSKLSRYLAPTTIFDLTASYKFLRHWQVFTQFSNLLDEEGTAYNGNESRPDYYEITKWSGQIGIRWNL